MAGMVGMRYQPQGRAQLDQRNPLVQGLVFASVAGGPDLISGVSAVRMGAASRAFFEQGKTLYTPGTTSDGWYWPLPSNHPLYGITTQDTIFVLARRVVGSSYNNLLGVPYKAGSWTSPYYAWNLGGQSDSTMAGYAFAVNSTTRNSVTGPSGLFADGVTRPYGATRNGTRVRFYTGNAQYTQDYSITAGSPDWSNKQPLVLFNRSNTAAGEGMSAHAGLVLVWNRELAADEWASLAQNPWQLFLDPYDEAEFVTVAAAATPTAAALGGAGVAQASGSGALTTAIPLAGAAQAAAAGAGALLTSIPLIGAAVAQASGSGALFTSIKLSGAAAAVVAALGALSTSIPLQGAAAGQAGASGTLTTSIKLTGSAQAVATSAASLPGTAASLTGTAVAQASGAGALTTVLKLSGVAVASTASLATLTTRVALSGNAAAGSSAVGTLTDGGTQVPGDAAIDVSQISQDRIVIFDGSGSRVVVFEGSGSRVVIFEGSGTRVRFDQMSAKVPVKVGDKWTTDRDPDEISYYAADVTQELLDRNTTADPNNIVAVLFGVELLEGPELQVASIDGVTRTFVVVKLGGVDNPPPDDWRWAARVSCLNGERFDKTTWFNKVDP